MHREFTEDDRTFLEGCRVFFSPPPAPTASPMSRTGRLPGFVRRTGPSELAFPSYDGNGMWKRPPVFREHLPKGRRGPR